MKQYAPRAPVDHLAPLWTTSPALRLAADMTSPWCPYTGSDASALACRLLEETKGLPRIAREFPKLKFKDGPKSEVGPRSITNHSMPPSSQPGHTRRSTLRSKRGVGSSKGFLLPAGPALITRLRLSHPFAGPPFAPPRARQMHNFNLMMNKYVQWADQLFPQLTFDDFVAKVEDLNKGPVKVSQRPVFRLCNVLTHHCCLACAALVNTRVCETRAPRTSRPHADNPDTAHVGCCRWTAGVRCRHASQLRGPGRGGGRGREEKGARK